jgi:hypothetical protein
MRKKFAVLAALVVLASGCSSKKGSGSYLPPPVDGQSQIGSEGGFVSFTLGSINGASITVPAGALSQTVTISLIAGTPIVTGDALAVGNPVLATPNGLAFATPVTVSVPYDATSIPSGETTGDIVVLRREESTGAISVLPVTVVNTFTALVQCQTSSLCTFQAAIFDGGAPTITGTASPSGGTPPAVPTSGGVAVTIDGTNLFAGATVTFGTTVVGGNAVTANATSTELMVTAPSLPTGVVNVTVTNLDGHSATFQNAFEY